LAFTKDNNDLVHNDSYDLCHGGFGLFGSAFSPALAVLLDKVGVISTVCPTIVEA
jgi:hypothetical protein